MTTHFNNSHIFRTVCILYTPYTRLDTNCIYEACKDIIPRIYFQLMLKMLNECIKATRKWVTDVIKCTILKLKVNVFDDDTLLLITYILYESFEFYNMICFESRTKFFWKMLRRPGAVRSVIFRFSFFFPL